MPANSSELSNGGGWGPIFSLLFGPHLSTPHIGLWCANNEYLNAGRQGSDHQRRTTILYYGIFFLVH